MIIRVHYREIDQDGLLSQPKWKDFRVEYPPLEDSSKLFNVSADVIIEAKCPDPRVTP